MVTVWTDREEALRTQAIWPCFHQGVVASTRRIKQWRGLATRYDKHATVYRAAVVLNAVIAWTRQLSDHRSS